MYRSLQEATAHIAQSSLYAGRWGSDGPPNPAEVKRVAKSLGFLEPGPPGQPPRLDDRLLDQVAEAILRRRSEGTPDVPRPYAAGSYQEARWAQFDRRQKARRAAQEAAAVQNLTPSPRPR